MWQRMAERVRAQRRQATVLAALLVVLGALQARRAATGGSPRPAQAAQAARTAPPAQAPLAPPTAAATALAHWLTEPIRPVSRDLFVMRREYYPVDPRNLAAARRVSADEGFWANLEKSLTLQADQKVRRENLIANYRAQAAALKVQATMLGENPKVMIDGELLGPGDEIRQFRVVSIESRRLVLERDGIRLQLMLR